MTERLEGKRVAILATDGFEQAELLVPRQALKDAHAEVDVVSPRSGRIQGFDHMKPDQTVEVDRTLSQADPRDYDALVLPGGAHNSDQLRIDEAALEFVRAFFEDHKPTGVICHAPWILIDAGLAKGRTLTSYTTIRTDLRNAGARVLDQEVVVDRNLITSRDPSDLPAFCQALIEKIGQAPQARAMGVGSQRTA
jgi:protease I